MKLCFIYIFLLVFILHLAAADAALPIAGNFSAVIPSEAGHPVPATNFLRRLERVVRQTGGFENNNQSRPLVLVLDPALRPGEVKFVYSDDFAATVLHLSADYRNWVEYPLLGRALTTALLQTRMGEEADRAWPTAARFVPDGLWGEFAAREKAGQRILRFTDLPGLRNMAECGMNITVSEAALQVPEPLRPGNTWWVLYTEKARLLLTVARSLSGSGQSSSPLKEYCLMVRDQRFAPGEAFERTFREAARQKLLLAALEDKSGSDAAGDPLNRLALQKLFSVHISMSGAGLELRLRRIEQVHYQHPAGKMDMTASLADLPLLVEKYESCLPLVRIKMAQLNDLAVIAPMNISSDIFDLTRVLSNTGTMRHERVSAEIKDKLQSLHGSLQKLIAVENILKQHEKQLMPLLYEQRFSLADLDHGFPLPPLTEKFLDEAERKLSR